MTQNEFYTELIDGAAGFTCKVDRWLADEKTPYQHIQIFENSRLGRVMILDGAMMLTDRDEHLYHEMLVHPALLAHPNPRRVLIIGGGDGGTLREAVKHPMVEEAILCEIDDRVIQLSREFLPKTAVGLDHPKSKVFVGDGLAYIRDHQNAFDVVIVDSTDPVGFAEGLFRVPFYQDVKRALRKPGVFVQQTESPFFHAETWRKIYEELRQAFSGVFPYIGPMPIYPSGTWTYAIGSDDLDPMSHFDPSRADDLPDLRYYGSTLQRSAFGLPKIFAELSGC